MSEKKKYKVLITSAGVGDPTVYLNFEFIGGEDHDWSLPSASEPLEAAISAVVGANTVYATDAPPNVEIYEYTGPFSIGMPFANPIQPER